MARASPGHTAALKLLRAALRFGLPAVGLLIVGRAGLLSIGGDIERWQFALGLLLIASGFTSTLVPGR